MKHPTSIEISIGLGDEVFAFIDILDELVNLIPPERRADADPILGKLNQSFAKMLEDDVD